MNSEFLKYINDEAQRLSGVYVPLRAGFLRQRLVRRVPLSWLRPNPDDEFCSRDIGPNDGIIARYARAYREMKPATDLTDFIPDGSFDSDSVLNPLIVQRIHPGGYMILNGHHRWAAARQVGRKTIRVCVVNLTQKQDVQKALDLSKNTKRATLDLDEVVFCEKGAPCEKALPFPLSRVYPQRVRLGVPALFHRLAQWGYDVWVYSSGYYSMDEITHLLGHHRARVTCAVTGTARKGPRGARMDEQLEAMLARKYTQTVHIDQKSILFVDSQSRRFEEYLLSGTDESWSREIIGLMGKKDVHANS